MLKICVIIYFLAISQDILFLKSFLKIFLKTRHSPQTDNSTEKAMVKWFFFSTKKAEVASEDRMILKGEKNCQGKVSE